MHLWFRLSLSKSAAKGKSKTITTSKAGIAVLKTISILTLKPALMHCFIFCYQVRNQQTEAPDNCIGIPQI